MEQEKKWPEKPSIEVLQEFPHVIKVFTIEFKESP